MYLNFEVESLHFVSFCDATDSFSADEQVWCIRLRDNHERHFDAYYFPNEYDNFIVQSRFDTTEAEVRRRSLAAFCFLSVILKSS